MGASAIPARRATTARPLRALAADRNPAMPFASDAVERRDADGRACDSRQIVRQKGFRQGCAAALIDRRGPRFDREYAARGHEQPRRRRPRSANGAGRRSNRKRQGVEEIPGIEARVEREARIAEHSRDRGQETGRGDQTMSIID